MRCASTSRARPTRTWPRSLAATRRRSTTRSSASSARSSRTGKAAKSFCSGRYAGRRAGVAQLVEHLICNQAAVGSSPTSGSLSGLAAQCRLDELRRRDLRVRILEDPGDLVAVEAAVEANADPASVPDVRRDIEPLRIGFDEHRLHPVRRSADEREAAVAVVAVPDGRERALVADEERRRAVREPLARLGQAEADLANGGQHLLLGHMRILLGSSNAASTRGSSAAIRALRT